MADHSINITTLFSAGSLVEDKYRVLAALGTGSMGTVFLGEDLTLERLVALKVISADAPEAVRRYFRQEAAAMAKIRHPNVAQIYSFGEFRGCPFFVMEYIQGEHVRSLLDRQPTLDGLPTDVALGILSQVCSGLAEVHRQGLGHYDLKPENIIIGPGYRVYLVDFGVAQSLAQTVPELAGTPPYIAPEVVEGTELPAAQRHLSDIFSLGVVAFELLSGAQPFVRPHETRDVRMMLKELAAQQPLPLSRFRVDLPRRFGEALACAMARDPAARFADSESFCLALREARDEAQRSRGGARQVLVVDDDADIRLMYRSVFEAVVPDAEVHAAADGLVAFELAKALVPALIVVDLNMPEVNGIELCSLLRSVDALLAVPIVVISAELTNETRHVLTQLGVAEMVSKPVRPRQIVDLASRYL